MPNIRPLVLADRPRVLEILHTTGHFTAAEVAIAMELVDAWIEKGEASDYLTYVFADHETQAVSGYVCFGPTPLTHGTYDLYWLAVDPVCQGRGIGRALTKFSEDEVRNRGGRLLLIETSSQALYENTVRFYEQNAYALVARIGNFYKPGDDQLIFAKELQAPVPDTPLTALAHS